MDQTGDPTGTGDGGPGYQFADEAARDGQPPVPDRLGGHGQLGAPNTNGSQFFVVTGSEGESLAPTTRSSAR